MNIFTKFFNKLFCPYKNEEWYIKCLEEEKREEEEEKEFQTYAKNIERINKLKREKVKKIIKYVHKENKSEKIIDKIIIFGSATREDCTEDSDIDMCIYSKKDVKDRGLTRIYGNIEIEAENRCDIFINYLQDKKFLQKIEKKGIVVYGN